MEIYKNSKVDVKCQAGGSVCGRVVDWMSQLLTMTLNSLPDVLGLTA